MGGITLLNEKPHYANPTLDIPRQARREALRLRLAYVFILAGLLFCVLVLKGGGDGRCESVNADKVETELVGGQPYG